MGIKGIYKEIGPGQRISLCKLATEHLEKTGRPFRLAIDISIWQFQVQAARGGSNPAIRTLFYRLVRLLGLAVQPVFVFDGPNKPTFKRNKKSGRADGVATAMAKSVIRLFGFAIHDAPGEAEAECALLQQQGVVDAVISEDVDTIMFGCRRTLRNWSAEGTKGSKTPTHVSMYEVGGLLAESDRSGSPSIGGLDREGMVLVALMSGGDYLPEGVPGCGVKVACEAARAGFGRDLCRIKRANKDALAAWKESLLHELRTNESRYFRTKHKALEIPQDFPNMEILRYYTHPVVSTLKVVDKVRRKLDATRPVDVRGLRGFVGETFDWMYRGGAFKLVRVLAPSLLVQLLLERRTEAHAEDLTVRQAKELSMVKAVSNRRAHFSTDATPELRVAFIPSQIVGLDLEAEPEEEVEAFGRTGIALNSDDEFEEEAGEELGNEQTAASGKKFDPLQPDLAWIPESVVKLGAPLAVESYDEKQRAKAVQAAAKKDKAKKTRAKNGDMPVGALEKYITTSPGTSRTGKRLAVPVSPLLSSSPPTLPAFLSTQDIPRPQHARAITTKATAATVEGGKSKQPKKPSKSQARKPTAATNPWTIAGSQSSPRASKPVAFTSTNNKSGVSQQPIIISSSPAPPPASPQLVTSLTAKQTTPTKIIWSQTPSTEENSVSSDPFGLPSSGHQKQKSPEAIAKRLAEKKPSSSLNQSTRGQGQYKRVKRGSRGTMGSNRTQKRITSFGKVLHSRTSFSVRVGAKSSIAPTSNEFLSDDDDGEKSDDLTLPSLVSLPSGVKSVGTKSASPDPPHGDFELSDEDDPFATPKLQASKSREVSASSGSVRGGSLSKPEVMKRGGTRCYGNDLSSHPSGADGPGPGSRTGRLNQSTITGAKSSATTRRTSKAKAPDSDPFSEMDDPVTVLSTAALGLTESGGWEERGNSTWRYDELTVVDLTGED